MTESTIGNAKVEIQNNEKKHLPSWVIPTVTTLVGVVVSLLVGWYQINLSEEQAFEAQKERTKAVKNELVQIVEEYVINQKMLDVSRLARLLEFRAKQEKLIVTPSVTDIIENAEFNIIKSQYLEFDKKQQFKDIFDDLYLKLNVSDELKYRGNFENTVNDIYISIQNGDTKDIPTKLSKVLNEFNNKIVELEAQIDLTEKIDINSFFKVLMRKPELIGFVFVIYSTGIYFMFYIRRRNKRRDEYLAKISRAEMDAEIRSQEAYEAFVLTQEAQEEYIRNNSEYFNKRYREKFEQDNQSEEVSTDNSSRPESVEPAAP